jgi:hypothetical protein
MNIDLEANPSSNKQIIILSAGMQDPKYIIYNAARLLLTITIDM